MLNGQSGVNSLQRIPFQNWSPQETDSNKKVRYLTKDENERLMAALIAREEEIRKGYECGYSKTPLKGEYADYLRPMVIISLNTGIRWGSLVSLQWDDIDLINRSLTIRAATTKSESQLIIPSTKQPWKPSGNGKRNARHRPKDLVFPSPVTEVSWIMSAKHGKLSLKKQE
jgi:integrase